MIPHAVRGNGKVAHTWYRPVLAGQPSPKGWRHIILTDPTYTAGLASGMGGIAMDYIVFPGERTFQSAQSFSLWVRHHVIKTGEDLNTNLIEKLWDSFHNERLNV